MINGTLIKTSLVDYPTRVAATYFLSGCNIRCPYCYNGELVLNQIPSKDLHSLQEVYEHLEKRKNVLSGFVISGGEPLIYSQTEEIIRKAKSLGYSVKLDTNGLFPDRLEKLFNCNDTSPDYIAVDIKTVPENYSLLKHNGNARKLLLKTIDIMQRLPTEQREFRTVLCPPLVSHNDIQEIAQMLPKDSRWFFAPFRNDNCLDPSYNNVQPYSDTQMEELLLLARETIKGAILR